MTLMVKTVAIFPLFRLLKGAGVRAFYPSNEYTYLDISLTLPRSPRPSPKGRGFQSDTR